LLSEKNPAKTKKTNDRNTENGEKKRERNFWNWGEGEKKKTQKGKKHKKAVRNKGSTQKGLESLKSPKEKKGGETRGCLKKKKGRGDDY